MVRGYSSGFCELRHVAEGKSIRGHRNTFHMLGASDLLTSLPLPSTSFDVEV